MIQRTIFISRYIPADSPFHILFPEGGATALIARSLLSFTPIRFSQVPAADWIFFSSPNGVRFFFEQVKKQDLALPAEIKWAVIGDGTSKALREQGKAPDFLGNGLPNQVAAAFGILASGTRILFPQAQNARQSIQTILETCAASCVYLPVYHNQIQTDIQIPETTLLIFTSPMNVQAYFNLYPERKHIPVIAIGESTREAASLLGIPRVHTSQKPSESALAQLALDILNQHA